MSHTERLIKLAADLLDAVADHMATTATERATRDQHDQGRATVPNVGRFQTGDLHAHWADKTMFGGANFNNATPGGYLAGLRQRMETVDSSLCECERWRDGLTVCPVHGTTKPEPVVTYAIPGPPPTEHKVTDMLGVVWIRMKDGLFTELDPDTGRPANVNQAETWVWLLQQGPLTLVPWTEEEKAEHELYGPPGARWGDPHTPCPWWESFMGPTDGSCALGIHHIGLHRNSKGEALGETPAPDQALPPYDQPSEVAGGAGISPHEAAETPCTCGNPAVHQPGCPRFERTSGHPPIITP